MKIYADNAATTKLSANALRAMMPYLEEQYGNPSSLNSEGQRAKEAIEGAREKIASLIGAHPREITFTSGGVSGAHYTGRADGMLKLFFCPRAHLQIQTHIRPNRKIKNRQSGTSSPALTAFCFT